MTFGFRVCFTFVGKGSLTSEEEFILFDVNAMDMTLKLSSGTGGVNIGQNDRFSISGGAFPTAEAAQAAAEDVRIALLQLAAEIRWGIDVGQLALKSFAMSADGKQYVAGLLKVHDVQADHLGITVFRDDPKPKFVRMSATGTASITAQTIVDQLSSAVGRFKFTSQKAEIAARSTQSPTLWAELQHGSCCFS